MKNLRKKLVGLLLAGMVLGGSVNILADPTKPPIVPEPDCYIPPVITEQM